jgi:carboxyl-terminal processing protease
MVNHMESDDPIRPVSEERGNIPVRRFLVFTCGVLFTGIIMVGTGLAGYLIGSTRQASIPPAFMEAWGVVHKEYVDQPVDDTKLVEGAIAGMIAALGDEHSGYLPPSDYSDAMVPLEGSYTGIGIEADASGPLLKIIAPFPGSPAAAAGLQAGDVIVGIDGADMTGVAPEAARRKVLGPAGSKVHLSILRDGNTVPLEFDIVRAKIEVPSMESKMLPGDIAYVRLYIFSDTTGTELHKALTELMAKTPKGLILDLRGNPGGLVDAAKDVASEFLPKDQVITIVRSGDGTEEKYLTKGDGLATHVPMVVLVDEGSASSSEMVAGALKDYGRAKLVGRTTYGKGSMQDWHPLEGGKAGAVRLTIARFYTPKGTTIAKIGISPDFDVTYSEEEFHAGLDPQLEKALALLAP